MTMHRIGTRQQWLAERLELLDAEKALTRQSDETRAAASGTALGPRRQELLLMSAFHSAPWLKLIGSRYEARPVSPNGTI